MIWTCPGCHYKGNLSHWMHCAQCGAYPPTTVVEKPTKKRSILDDADKIGVDKDGVR